MLIFSFVVVVFFYVEEPTLSYYRRHGCLCTFDNGNYHNLNNSIGKWQSKEKENNFNKTKKDLKLIKKSRST